MLIDWFTVGAQALNFLILIWLLKRFLYKPILNAVDTREARIKKERADADAIKTAAEAARDDFQKKTAAFDKDRAALMQKAMEAAAAEGQRLMTDAKAAADALTAKRAKAMQTEAKALNKALTARVQDEVFAITRKTLTDLADVSLEDRICEVFIYKIKGFKDQPKSPLSEAIRATSDPILVRSAFDLTKAQHAAIRSAVQKTFSTDAAWQFDTAPDLISGIELTVGGQKLAWSIADYLASLKAGVDDVLKAKDHPKTDPEADPKADPEAGPKPDAKVEVPPNDPPPKDHARKDHPPKDHPQKVAKA